jgi:hypothetical protein
VQQLVTHTGTYDRWAEAVIENSYGRLSLLSDPVVLPTLYMPQGAAAGQNAFAYSEAPVSGHVQAQGYDMSSDFHTVLVISGWILKLIVVSATAAAVGGAWHAENGIYALQKRQGDGGAAVCS